MKLPLIAMDDESEGGIVLRKLHESNTVLIALIRYTFGVDWNPVLSWNMHEVKTNETSCIMISRPLLLVCYEATL